MKSSNLSNERRQGLTLVEVVAGIVLLSSLLVLLLGSFRVHASQVRGAKKRMLAIRAADGLLDNWFSGAGIPPAGQQGQLSDPPNWFWRLVPGPHLGNPALPGAATIRLEIWASDVVNEDLLTSVELLVPAKGAAAR